jgi:hypothetical protein
MPDYGYYWVKEKTSQGLIIMEYVEDYDGSWMQCGWDAPINIEEFDIICKINPPEKMITVEDLIDMTVKRIT